MQKNGPWSIKATKITYENPWISVREDQVVRPDGKDGIYGVVTVKPAVTVLALDDEGFVYLTSQFRYTLKRLHIEVCAGAIDEGEAPLTAAKRELQEELGIIAGKWTELGTTFPFTSVVYAPQTFFLAQGLEFTANNPEGTEVITTVKYTFQEALGMALDGTIAHTPSCTLLMRAANHLGLIEINTKQVT